MKNDSDAFFHIFVPNTYFTGYTFCPLADKAPHSTPIHATFVSPTEMLFQFLCLEYRRRRLFLKLSKYTTHLNFYLTLVLYPVSVKTITLSLIWWLHLFLWNCFLYFSDLHFAKSILNSKSVLQQCQSLSQYDVVCRFNKHIIFFIAQIYLTLFSVQKHQEKHK